MCVAAVVLDTHVPFGGGLRLLHCGPRKHSALSRSPGLLPGASLPLVSSRLSLGLVELPGFRRHVVVTDQAARLAA
jgi:hypothetical protein